MSSTEEVVWDQPEYRASFIQVATNGDLETLRKLAEAENAPELLLESVDAKGNTALMCAATNSHTSCVEFLLSNGAQW